jgi:transcriptional regulator with PAS, ATPase and Fis domain
MKINWADEINADVTVCDLDGKIIYMNDHATRTFKKEGGKKLVGTDIKECHPEPSRSMLTELLIHQKENVYFTKKNGVKKLVFQTPWFNDGQYGGLVEISIELPLGIKTKKR